ncbi:MlaD family protein [bacterium]|nr:MlaD family protein [bacterium]
MKNETRAGFFVVATLALLAATVLTLGKEKQIFASQEVYYTSFEDVRGLKVGAPIRLGGITIGRVSQIGFAEDLIDNTVYVTLEINEKFTSRLKVDSKTSIASQGLLGDRFLQVSSGTKASIVTPGGNLQSEETGDISDILQHAGTVTKNISSLSSTLEEVVGDFQIHSAQNIRETLADLNAITEAVRSGDGLAHRVIFSKEDGDRMIQDMESAFQSVVAITKEIESGDGLLHKLIFSPEAATITDDFFQTAENLSEASIALREVMAEIRDGHGLLHGLIYGEEPGGLDELSQKLAEIINNLESATSALQRGSGTLGALLMDSSLYDNLVEITDDAKRSFLLRSAIRATLND